MIKKKFVYTNKEGVSFETIGDAIQNANDSFLKSEISNFVSSLFDDTRVGITNTNELEDFIMDNKDGLHEILTFRRFTYSTIHCSIGEKYIVIDYKLNEVHCTEPCDKECTNHWNDIPISKGEI